MVIDLSWITDQGWVHMAPAPGEFLTPCCNLGVSELYKNDLVTTLPSEVTCPVSWPGRTVNESGRTSMPDKLEGSQERLLKARARLIRASSSEINSALREELLGLIDKGE